MDRRPPNFKRGYGFHPLPAFVYPGEGGTGEPLVAVLRPGKAGADDAADQVAVLDAELTRWLPDAFHRLARPDACDRPP